jgi:transposase
LLRVEELVVESVNFDASADAVVVSVRPFVRAAGRCGVCRQRCAGFDQGRGRRRWRAVDVGTTKLYLEADAPRVRCPEHGVVVVSVPWARHGAGHTYAFDDQAAWLVRYTSRSTVSTLLRVAWRTAGVIVARVMADIDAAAGDRLAGVRRIGIDEVSYKKGHKYLTVVIDHESRRVLWIGVGRSKAVLAEFFALLGPERCAQIALVSADAADWIYNAVTDHCPNARLCLDPFHVVAWATEALDDIRRQVWNDARRSGQKALAAGMKDSRYALWKNPSDLTAKQHARLAWIVATNKPLYRAYLLKEQLRQVFAPGGEERSELLDEWLFWASHSRLRPFVELARKIRTYYRDEIVNTLTYRLSNGLVESTNTKIRLLTRIAYGFRDVNALIAIVKLHLGGYNIELPGRT